MQDSGKIEDKFSYSRGNYYGEFTPQNFAVNINLQRFAQQVIYLGNLEANGEIKLEDACEEITKLWKQLKHSQKELPDNTDFTAE